MSLLDFVLHKGPELPLDPAGYVHNECGALPDPPEDTTAYYIDIDFQEEVTQDEFQAIMRALGQVPGFVDLVKECNSAIERLAELLVGWCTGALEIDDDGDAIIRSEN